MKKFSILQVEDEENDVLLMQVAFRESGIMHPLFSARDGQEAIDYLAGNGKFADRDRFPPPCLMFLDLKLPRKMGLDVIRWVRSQPSLQTLIVIVFSSSPQPDDINSVYRAGANSFLVKPSGLNELITMLEAFKAYWLVYNQPPTECADAFEASGPATSRAGLHAASRG